MGVYTLTSAGGSPGVTTTVLALAASWPRPVVVVEADPTGGSAILAGYYKGTLDQPGLIELAMANRQGQLGTTLPRLLRPIDGTQASLLAGTRSHDQAIGLEPVWQPLLEVLRRLEDNGQDVLVDAGRLGLAGAPMPLVVAADVTAVLTRSDLPAISAARSWANTLRDRATGRLGIVTVGDGKPYTGREIATALELPLLGGVEWAPTHAAVYAHGAEYPAPRGLARLGGRRTGRDHFAASAYARSITTLTEAMRRSADGVSTPVIHPIVEEPVR